MTRPPSVSVIVVTRDRPGLLAGARASVVAQQPPPLEVRVGDREFGLVGLILHLAGRADHVGQGSLTLGLVNGLAAGLALAWGLWRMFSGPDIPGEARGVARARAGFLLASIGIVLVWHLLFRNHSTIHSEFMVRTFAWVWIAAWVTFAMGLRLRAAQQEWSAAYPENRVRAV